MEEPLSLMWEVGGMGFVEGRTTMMEAEEGLPSGCNRRGGLSEQDDPRPKNLYRRTRDTYSIKACAYQNPALGI
jgi:hypothetical protein